MTGQEAIAYIHSFSWEQHAPGLHRMRELLAALGDPHKRLKFIHVAGTNGKGSTCACMASMLKAAGYRVGLNTSPYLLRFNERIQVNGQQITDEELAELVEQVRVPAEIMQEHPTEFELITAIAMLYFVQKKCDIVVLEVGLGGALDASNVIGVPKVTVLTAMGMDHVALLGPTMADIAEAKAGIIKSCGTVVSYGGCEEADEVFHRVCTEQGAILVELDESRLVVKESGLDGSTFDFLPHTDLHLSLAGAYQRKNAAVAIMAMEILAAKGWNISEDAIRKGLADVSWPGRFEVLRREPAFLLDGAHNAHGMTATAASLRECVPQGGIVFLIGILADKDVSEMLNLLAPQAAAFVTIRPNSPRALSPEELAEKIKRFGLPVQACASVEEGVLAAAKAAGKDGTVCALGSLYMAGDVKRAVAQLPEKLFE